MSEQTVNEEMAEEITADEALEYLRRLPQFQVVMRDVFEARLTEIGLGMASASQENAQRLCGQYTEVANFLHNLRK